MNWRDRVLRTPTWPEVGIKLAVGAMMLALAVLKATVWWDETEMHDDGLMVVGFAVAGGLALGIALEMARRRIAAGTSV